jgi:hypothetical protein
MGQGRPCPSRARPESQYANHFKVGYNAFEFVIEFGQQHVGAGAETVHTRIVTAPQYAKTLAGLLSKSIVRHRKAFGSPRPPARRSRAHRGG